MADDVEIKLKGVRLSFLHVFEPQDRKNDDGDVTGKNYNCSVLIPKTDKAQIDLVKEAMAKARKNEWGESPPRFAPDQLCLRDGEPVDPDTVDENVPGSGTRVPLYDGYAGMMYVSANRPVKLEDYQKIKNGQRKRPVRVIGPRKDRETGKFEELNEGDPYAPYSGCYANVILRIYGYTGQNGQKSRINASLEAIQFVRDGEAFGARGVDVDSAFDEEDVGEDDMGGGAPAKSPAAAEDDFNIG